ncbi:MAG: GDP-mannose 4,6-dehydratase [Patescibacteria group bacterium]|nr:GDP-mannose 4,6-dehydratase [Patescibacteria group bacterium]MDD5490734.1 GDP-mannose 4,6-dehydratase [Patescibacteria group bacterium]
MVAAKKPIFGKKNVLIAGGAGFMGSHLCDRLIKESKVICVDNFLTSNVRNIEHLLRSPDFVFINHDITKPFDLENFPELEKFKIPFQGIQEIYNFACPTSPKKFDDFKIQTLEANSTGLINLLEIARRYNSKFIHASSSVIYGPRTEEIVYFKESDVGVVNHLTPRGCYDEGKKFAETIVNTYHDVYKLDTKIARIFRTYGTRMRINDGEMVPDFIVNALDSKDLVIYGDKSFSTSLCHIDDVISGIVKLASLEINEPVNLGGPQEYKLAEVAEKIIEMTESKSKIVFEKPLLFMTPLGLPDITKAKEELGWLPIVTLESGLKQTIEYTMAEKGLLGFN